MEGLDVQLLKALMVNREAYLHNFWATLAALLVAIGWLLNSKESRAFLASHYYARLACSISVIVLFFMHVGVLVYTYRGSEKLASAYKSCVVSSDATTVLIDFYSVKWFWFVFDALVNGVVVVLLIVLLFQAGRRSQ